jgi:hypothetical protein
MMKRIFTFSLLMLAFAMNAVAYDDEKIVERHSFRLLYPDDGNVYTGNDQSNKFTPRINLSNNCIQTIEQQYNWNSTTTQVSYKSWLHNEDRFLLQPTDNPTAYALDLTNVNQGAIPQGWRCVQEGDDVHEYNESYNSGARVLTGFQDGGRGLYWRKNIVEYGHQDAFPLSLFKGSYSLTFRMAKRGDNPNGYTLKILRISNDNTTAEVTSHSYENPSTVSASPEDANLGNIQEETLTFNIEEAGNYIIRFIANDPDSDNKLHGYILASCQLTRNGASWQITKNARADKGFGLVNVSGSYKGLKILHLKAGDVVRFAYFLNSSSSHDHPLFKASQGSITGRHQSWSDTNVATLAEASVINGSFDIFVDTDGDLDINCPSGILIREVTITLAECPRASYIIEPVEGTHGYRYTITGVGVLKEKHPALPYITTRFGNDNDMTIVKDFGNGVLAASSIIDPSNNLDIEDYNVKISAHYKKRYQNIYSHYVDYGQVASDYQYDSDKPGYDNNPYDSQYNAETEATIKALAQEEANSLKGREWTVFEATNVWNVRHDWGGRPANSPGNDSNDPSSGSKSLSYKWEDDFNSIYPLYGSYYYFFPSVKGKLKVKFYCEGAGEHMPLWMKLDGQGNFVGAGDQDGHTQVKVKKSGDSEFTPSAFGCNSVLNTNIYEYEAQLERGGVYYLCSNPTLVSREHPVIRLISYEFIPDFLVSPIYKVVDNGTENVAEACIIKGGPFPDLTVNKERQITINGENNHPEVKFLGNVTGADFEIVNGPQGDEQTLKITKITYKDEDEKCNKGGAIVVNLHCEAGHAAFVLTVAYSAAEAKMDADNNRKGTAKNSNNHTIEVKKWDFFSGVGDGQDHGWDLGKYGSDDGTRFVAGENNTAWKAKSRLFKEVHKADGLTYDWVMEYLDETDPNNPKEQIFKSVFDMEGDNADMIHETAGLLFHTETYLMGINNENPAPSATTFNDRYIGLIGDNHFDVVEHPRSFIIPKLTAGDRIVIKMGRYGNDAQGLPCAHLTITGANDAINQPITGDYVIGGSGVDGNGNITDLSKPYGEYHFISTGGDFELKAVDVPLLKIYSIEIYRNAANDNADILTENEVTGNKNEILYTADVNGNKSPAETIDIQLRYNGKNEPKSYFAPAEGDKANYTGTFRSKAVKFTGSGDTYTYTPANTEFGAFKARMGVKTTDNAYVTDYADRYMAVGYRETKPYPYTWDFTDLRSYVGTQANHDYLSPELSQPVSEWGSTKDYDYALHLTTDKFPGVLFASGSQLYAGANVFEESAGIGFKRDESLSLSQLKAYDEGLQLLEDGLKLDCPSNEYRLVIPQVGANAAVYVRATPLTGVSSKYSTDGTNANNCSEKATASNDDKIYAIKNDGSSPVDIELWLNHMIIRKIAVATDQKTVNAKGWATESRERVTDPELAAYMTGKDIRTYVVSDVNYAGKQVTLTRIDNANYLVPIAHDGDNNATILLNFKSKNDKGVITGEPVDIINGGFHLFVPDMHEAETKTKWSGTNYLVSQVTGSEEVPAYIPAVKDGYTNFAFASQYVDIDPETGAIKSGVKQGAQAFYRIAGGTNGKATSKGHQGYLPIKIEENTDGAARFNLMIIDGDEATGVTSLEQVAEDNGRYFNLNGQQLSGKPNRSGLYIVNGKKVYVKNK